MLIYILNCPYSKVLARGISLLFVLFPLLPNNVDAAYQSSVSVSKNNNQFQFDRNSNISLNELSSDYRTLLGLGTSDEIIRVRDKYFNKGYSSHKFIQKYTGLLVETGELVVKAQDGVLFRGFGNIVKGLSINTTPTISEEDARWKAINYIKAEKYIWEDNTEEENLPKPFLLIACRDITKNEPNNYRLAYRVNVVTKKPFGKYYVYVDAHTGEILRTRTLLIPADVGASAATLYYGTKNIRAWSQNNKYILKDSTRGNPIVNLISKQIVPGSCGSDTGCHWYIKEYADTNWNGQEDANYEKPSASAHWAGEKVFDYFKYKLNRNGVDNAQENPMPLIFNIGGITDNAYWDEGVNEMVFGSGGGVYTENWSDFVVSIDAVGHEFAHGVSINEVNFAYYKEPGALAESFSDIFGTLSEWYVDSNNLDYYIGEDWVRPESLYMRNLSDPHAKQQPDTYDTNDIYWYDVRDCIPDQYLNDNCGVHKNGGVQNYWFYLLSEGDTGTNENGDSYNVTGIGVRKAGEVAYINLCNELFSSSGYLSSRDGSIRAAMDISEGIYESSGNFTPISGGQVAQVVKAWHATGIGELEYSLSNDTIDAFTTYYAATTITAGTNLVVNGANGNLELYSGDSIILKPGFEVKNGSKLYAVTYNTLSQSPKRYFEQRPQKDIDRNVASDYFLNQNVPNPFNPNTSIKYGIPKNSARTDYFHVLLQIYDVRGRLINTIVNEYKKPGIYFITWNGASSNGKLCSNGVYFYTLKCGDSFAKTKRMILVK